MRKINVWIVLAAAAALVPFAFYSYVYPDLGETLPIHFNGHGEADRFVSKSSPDVWMLCALGVIGFGIMMAIRSVMAAKKSHASAAIKLFDQSLLLTTVLFSGIGVFALMEGMEQVSWGAEGVIHFVILLLGLIFMLTGNYMPKLRRNAWAGIRTPVTMKDDAAWFKAQRRGGRVFMIGGLLTMLAALLPGELSWVMAIAIFLVMMIFSLIYGFKN
ncbi:SdpI family protein [Paenibacillus sp. JX-17]|uniref:SdpI family protein n=1 Tax=Paenibacillus lacisoli TaxID=3064525 RepID=A0ABT9CG34_9BACL|nr:SdpI family protein [Paenibacillus sp. JX-17]MDO7908249.1 SdpI family protein [Paenibacillus sp. JX-17]